MGYECKRDMEDIVKLNQASGKESLSATQWAGMEKAMPDEERLTHDNLRSWMRRHAMSKSVVQNADVLEDDDDDAELVQILESLDVDATVRKEKKNNGNAGGGDC